MWNEFLTAIALLLIIEGIMPFLNPEGLRKMLALTLQMDNSTLRFVGLSAMIAGLVLLYIVH
jgi:uncharacterized protein YjeT (DUF2065 family)